MAAAGQVAKILDGVQPLRQATRVELVINLRRDRKVLGLTILPSVRLRADEVIQ